MLICNYNWKPWNSVIYNVNHAKRNEKARKYKPNKVNKATNYTEKFMKPHQQIDPIPKLTMVSILLTFTSICSALFQTPPSSPPPTHPHTQHVTNWCQTSAASRLLANSLCDTITTRITSLERRGGATCFRFPPSHSVIKPTTRTAHQDWIFVFSTVITTDFAVRGHKNQLVHF